MASAACRASGRKRNVLNYLIHQTDRSTLLEGEEATLLDLCYGADTITKPFRHFNDRAVYTCEDGYQIVGSEQVLCNSDGLWSGTMPSCKKGSSSAQSRYYCGEPTHIANAKHNGTKDQVITVKGRLVD